MFSLPLFFLPMLVALAPAQLAVDLRKALCSILQSTTTSLDSSRLRLPLCNNVSHNRSGIFCRGTDVLTPSKYSIWHSRCSLSVPAIIRSRGLLVVMMGIGRRRHLELCLARARRDVGDALTGSADSMSSSCATDFSSSSATSPSSSISLSTASARSWPPLVAAESKAVPSS